MLPADQPKQTVPPADDMPDALVATTNQAIRNSDIAAVALGADDETAATMRELAVGMTLRAAQPVGIR